MQQQEKPRTPGEHLRAHWFLYVDEGLELALFMLSACAFSVWLFAAGSRMEHYVPEAVLAKTLDGVMVAALCYNLTETPRPDERNPDYAIQLQKVLRKLDFPSEYVESIA